jgi:RNA polymerase sigma-70 factor (ECF subfamily)
MKENRSDKNRATEKLFLEMHDSFSDEIFRFCLSKTRNRDLALDITQETFMKTWDYLRNGKTIDMARAFLYRTARNLIIDHSRKKQALSLDAMFNDESPSEDIPDTSTIPSGVVIDQQFMIEKLKQLPEQHFEILTLRFIQELTIPEIAKIYKESENTISVRIHRAIKLAQKLFPEELYE